MSLMAVSLRQIQFVFFLPLPVHSLSIDGTQFCLLLMKLVEISKIAWFHATDLPAKGNMAEPLSCNEIAWRYLRIKTEILILIT